MKICFVSSTIYPLLLRGEKIKRTGGAEVQQYILAQGFVARGHEVSFVTIDHEGLNESRNGFQVITTYRPDEGIPGIRFFYPRVPKIWNALKRASADIYYVRGAGYLVALVDCFCKKHKKKGVFAVAHDANVVPGLRPFPTMRDRFLYEWGLKRIDHVVSQTFFQREMLLKHYNRRSVVIRNAFKYESEPCSSTNGRDIFLWVAMIRESKNPFHFIRLAKRNPEKKFVMIGHPLPGEEKYYHELLISAKGVKNLELTGFLSLDETRMWFNRAIALVNTSFNEGFPNTFLQAWQEGIPVISYIDPDKLISKYGLGVVVRDQYGLDAAVVRASNQTNSDQEVILSYFNSNHSLDNIVELYEKLFSRSYQ